MLVSIKIQWLTSKIECQAAKSTETKGGTPHTLQIPTENNREAPL